MTHGVDKVAYGWIIRNKHSCKGITMVDHVHFLANSEYDGFVMFNKTAFSYMTGLSCKEKGKS